MVFFPMESRFSTSKVDWAFWGASLGLALQLAGCAGLFQPSLPDDRYRLACGQQCLKNGEDCSRFFALKNEERRVNFEQAKANYWICMRRYGDSKPSTQNPCVAPGPLPEAYDHCGTDLEQCLSACPVSLDELPGLHGSGSPKPSETLPAAGRSGGAGTLTPSDGLSVFK